MTCPPVPLGGRRPSPTVPETPSVDAASVCHGAGGGSPPLPLGALRPHVGARPQGEQPQTQLRKTAVGLETKTPPLGARGGAPGLFHGRGRPWVTQAPTPA